MSVTKNVWEVYGQNFNLPFICNTIPLILMNEQVLYPQKKNLQKNEKWKIPSLLTRFYVYSDPNIYVKIPKDNILAFLFKNS